MKWVILTVLIVLISSETIIVFKSWPKWNTSHTPREVYNLLTHCHNDVKFASRFPNAQHFWISNSMIIPDADAHFSKSEMDDIASIYKFTAERAIFPIQSNVKANPWNIDNSNAPLLWNLGITGKGVVVANIDTGVNMHPGLVEKYRGKTGSNTFSHDYNWWDGVKSGTSDCAANSQIPCDDHNHGFSR